MSAFLMFTALFLADKIADDWILIQAAASATQGPAISNTWPVFWA